MKLFNFVRIIRVTTVSYEAFKVDEMLNSYIRNKKNREINEEIITDSELDNPTYYLKAGSAKSEHAQEIIKKKIATIQRQKRRRRAKLIAERHFLGRTSKRLSTIIQKHPNIGKTIEMFVQDCYVGADQWRRTGVLTFDGNRPIKKKCTYGRIKQYLESVYWRKFAYGTVVQLCVCRNRRRLSAHRYHGIAHVTSRRACKGFMLRYNPDSHWSSAMYCALNYLQYKDGTNVQY